MREFINFLFQVLILVIIIALILQMKNNVMYLCITLAILAVILIFIHQYTKRTTVRRRTYEDFLSKKRKSLIPQAPFYIESIPPWEKYNSDRYSQLATARGEGFSKPPGQAPTGSLN